MSNAAFQFSQDSYDASVPIPTSVQPTSNHLPTQPLSPLLFGGPTSSPPVLFPEPTIYPPGSMLNPYQDPEKLPSIATKPPPTGRSRRFWIVLGLVILLVIVAVGVGVGVSVSHHSSSSNNGNGGSSSSSSSGSSSSSSSSGGNGSSSSSSSSSGNP